MLTQPFLNQTISQLSALTMRYFYAKATLDHATVSIAGVSVSVDMLLESASRPKTTSKNAWHRSVYLGIMMPAALHSLLAKTCLVVPLLLRLSLVNCAMLIWLGMTRIIHAFVDMLETKSRSIDSYSYAQLFKTAAFIAQRSELMNR